ncbi:hypothetical protein EVAR_36403_1 [Eumeta japonica]|uniref:MADF domain-containing protein n=1 Tax=Eumeta variegata TaxID=151549 RepID=A0A4C1VQN5_EUMVA|nr:hypothetical protein EVAR_36403_1 [Eumeta japonica]
MKIQGREGPGYRIQEQNRGRDHDTKRDRSIKRRRSSFDDRTGEAAGASYCYLNDRKNCALIALELINCVQCVMWSPQLMNTHNCRKPPLRWVEYAIWRKKWAIDDGGKGDVMREIVTDGSQQNKLLLTPVGRNPADRLVCGPVGGRVGPRGRSIAAPRPGGRALSRVVCADWPRPRSVGLGRDARRPPGVMRESEKKFLLKIVDLFKQMRFLWDKADGDYLNRQKRQEGFEILLEIYNQFDPDANVTTLKKKLENMRTTFNRELKKEVNTDLTPFKGEGLCNGLWFDRSPLLDLSMQAPRLPRSLSHAVVHRPQVHAAKDSGEPYTPSLWYYDAFCFLQEGDEQSPYDADAFNSFDEGSRPSSAESNSKQTLDEQSPDLQNQHPSKRLLERIEEEEMPVLPKKKQRMNLIKDEAYLEAAQRFMNEEAWEIIGKAIGIQLRDLEKRQLAIAQKIISDAIFYAKMEKLTEESFILLTSNKL